MRSRCPRRPDRRAVAFLTEGLTDITEFGLPAATVCLSPIIDCFDGMVVSWPIGTHPDAELVNTMLDDAAPIVHSDRGAHYRWPGWIERTSRRRAAHPTTLPAQARQDVSLAQSLADLMDIELIPRKERAARGRVKLSGMPAIKRLEDFDWLGGGMTRRQLAELASLAFVARKENLVLMGPSGLGKMHLMLALAHKACLSGHTAWYTSCVDLIDDLGRAREHGRLKRRLVWMRKPHILLIDEVGYEELTKEQADL